jgi:hypothetical protein
MGECSLTRNSQFIEHHRSRRRQTMKTFKCLGCRCKRLANPRSKNQKYCGLPDCQRARKRVWQQKKRASDPDYLKNLRDSQKRWQESQPDYWREYRRKHPKKTTRTLTFEGAKSEKLSKDLEILSGNYILSILKPVQAKTDTFHVKIRPATTGYAGENDDTIGRSVDLS